MTEFRRKLYKRGSSYETTLPMPLLFLLDKNQKHDVLFKLDPETGRWYLNFDKQKEKKSKKKQNIKQDSKRKNKEDNSDNGGVK